MKSKNYISINDTNIYYEVKGKGIPILIIHGWSVDHNLMSGSMEKVFKKENKIFKRIYIDLPGMGKSSVNPNIKNADDVIAILLKFIDQVILSEKFLLVGESWGGALCRGILEYKKESVLGLCLLCPVSISGEKNISKPSRTVLEVDKDFLETLGKKEREYFSFMSVIQTKKCWDLFKRDIYPTIINNDYTYLGRILKGAYKKSIYTSTLDFDRPVLLLSGRQDNVVGYEDQTKYFMNLPRATTVVLDKAGHNLQIEQEALFQSLISDWLTRVRTFELAKQFL